MTTLCILFLFFCGLNADFDAYGPDQPTFAQMEWTPPIQLHQQRRLDPPNQRPQVTPAMLLDNGGPGYRDAPPRTLQGALDRSRRAQQSPLWALFYNGVLQKRRIFGTKQECLDFRINLPSGAVCRSIPY